MVRIALEDDVAAIQLIAKLTLVDAYEGVLSPEVQEKFLDEHYSQVVIKDRIHNMNILMGENEFGTVGFVIYTSEVDFVEIIALYVLPQHQRQGVGKNLLDAVFGFAKDSEKCVKIDLESRNLKAQKFYTKEGFEVEESFPRDLHGQPLKMLRFVRKCDEHKN